MLRAHSLLWHYLWIAPNLLLLFLAFLIWQRKIYKEFPVFIVFAVVGGIVQLTVYAADVLPSVSAIGWWKVFWGGLLLEALVKFALVGEIFGRVFGIYPSVAKLSKSLISGVGVVLVFLAAVAAAYTPKNSIHSIISGAHILEQTIYMIECGLIVFLFILAAYFRLCWNRSVFGLALGLGVSACVHLATWALAANGNLSVRYRQYLDFPNMFAYHLSILIWYYYLLVPQKKNSKPEPPGTSEPPPPEHDLEAWNQELERLLHQ